MAPAVPAIRVHHAANNAQILFAARRKELPAVAQLDVASDVQSGLRRISADADAAVVLNRHQHSRGARIEIAEACFTVATKVQLPTRVVAEANETGVGSAVARRERKESVDVGPNLQ